MRNRKLSAGLLLYRRSSPSDDEARGLWVLLAHPGGPFFLARDAGGWTVPKGAVEEGEELLTTACREFSEETGLRNLPPTTGFLPLGFVQQRSGKRIHAWAVEGTFEPAAFASNTFDLEWPRGSGKVRAFPEIDRVAWFDLAEARRRLNPAQVAFIDRLEAALSSDPSSPR